MDYRGPDLDLRTSRWSASSTDPSGWREASSSGPAAGIPARSAGGRPAPIWVDETLIACANQAYDVALAYRSGEVQLEHLLFAMTRVEAAAAALEARGIRPAALRQDTALAIAGELPAAGAEAPAQARRSAELEEVLRFAAARAGHGSRPAGVNDIVQVLGEVGSELSCADLVVRHFPRLPREQRPARGALRGGLLASLDGEGAHEGSGFDQGLVQRLFERLVETERALSQRLSAVEAERVHAASHFSSAADEEMMQRLFERLGETERALSERLAAVEATLAGQPLPVPTDLSPLDMRLSAIESALQSRPADNVNWTLDATLAERLTAIEEAIASERAERASAITALSDEITGVRSAVRLAAQNSEQAQAALLEQLHELAAVLEQQGSQSAVGLSERIAHIEATIDAQASSFAATHEALGNELGELQERLMKINAAQSSLAGAIDHWRNNDSGEMHLINARIGSIHEDGARRLAAIEKLCADVDALSRLILDDKTREPTGFKRWLYGTEDWLKASWSRARTPRRADGPPPVRRSWAQRWQRRTASDWRWPLALRRRSGG